MPPRLAPPKIRAEHLDREALIYVRQSTPMQVRDNVASTARQYDLARRAEQFGWPKDHIHVIDQDQGHSGASTVGRDGFQFLMAEVGLGRAGAVLSLEASRLARSCSDWYRLIEICGLTDTLVIDEDGVYDPTQYNDRLLLGIKGTMSEAELHWIRSRLLGGKLEKARTGQLRSRLPTGLVYNPAGQTVLDPDEQVQEALRLVFDTFERVGAALRVVQDFAKNRLRVPTRHYGGSRDGQLTWRPLDNARVLAILHNPTYTGTYVYGRTKTRNVVLPGEEPRIKGRTRGVVAEDWPFVLHDHHPGYISWEQFQRNQQRLLDNCTFDHQKGNAWSGSEKGRQLCHGGLVLFCGRCGRRMTIRYLDDGKIPLYECNQLHKQHGEKTCQSLRGDRIDEAVSPRFPGSHAAGRSLRCRWRPSTRSQHAWRRKADRRVGIDGGAGRATEAELARRRLQPLHPENRLVTRTLERDWEARLAEVERPGAAISRTAHAVDHAWWISAERALNLGLGAGSALAVASRHDDAGRARKQLLGFLIKDVCLTRADTTIEVAIRWRTEACTVLNTRRPKRSCEEPRRTDPVALTRLRAPWRQSPQDGQIAQILNQEGFHSRGQAAPSPRPIL